MYDRVGDGEETYLLKNLFKRELQTASALNELVLYSPSKVVCRPTAFHVAFCPKNNRPLIHKDSITGNTVILL